MPCHAMLRSASGTLFQRNVCGASRAGLPGGGFAMARFLRDCFNKRKAYPKHKESDLVKTKNIHPEKNKKAALTQVKIKEFQTMSLVKIHIIFN